MDVPEVIEFLIDLRKSKKQSVTNYIQLLKVLENIENNMMNKINNTKEHMTFIENMYKEAIDNYHKISVLCLK